MKFNCSIVDDLLPLYLEDVCSDDSKAALEDHLRECSACREKLGRMNNRKIIPQMQETESIMQVNSYAKKVKRHRLRVGVLVVLLSTIAVCVLSLCLLAMMDMRSQADPTVHAVEEGIYNLTAEDLETTAAKAGTYILFTNSTQIKVTIPENNDDICEILLWNATDKENPSVIQYGSIVPDTNTCVFTGLSAAQRYMVTCSGAEDMVIIVSEGRVVDFWNSLVRVLGQIFG